MKVIKVSLKGRYLPDIGGISIHISRLAEILFARNGLNCVYSTNFLKEFKEHRFIVANAFWPKLRYGAFQNLYWFIKYGIRDHSDVFHIHGNPVWESHVILLMLFLNKNIVYTVHDQIILSNKGNYPSFFRYLFKLVVSHKNIYWIAVNSKIKGQIIKIQPKCKNVTVIPAYLPKLPDNSPLNREIEAFLKSKSKILSIYAHLSTLGRFKGKDLYGIDLALKAINVVKKEVPEIGLVISIPDLNEEKYFEYKHIIDSFQLNNEVLLFSKPLKNAINLWRRSNIVLRPTLTDGDSLVVREALAQKTFVIASDVVQRPKNVILFKSGDIQDLSQKILQTLNRERDVFSSDKQSVTNFERIDKIYQKLISDINS